MGRYGGRSGTAAVARPGGFPRRGPNSATLR
jgi:hypothetical protein